MRATPALAVISALKRHRRITVAVLSCLFLANVVHWSLLFPYNSVPDEHVRYFMIDYIDRFGHLPRGPGLATAGFIGSITHQAYNSREWWYYGMPNLDIRGAWTTTQLFRGTLLPAHIFLSTRVFNWLLAVPFAISMMSIGWYASGRRVVGWLITIIVITIPQLTFIFSYVNSDALSLTVCSVAVRIALLYRDRQTPILAVLLGTSLGILCGTKIYYLPAIPAVGVLVFGSVWTSRQKSKAHPKPSLTAMACLLVAAAAILVPTYFEYGDAFGMTGQRDFLLLHMHNPSFRYGTCFVLCPGDLVNGPELKWWLQLTFFSFFFSAGYLDIFQSKGVYIGVYMMISLTALVASAASVLLAFNDYNRGYRFDIVQSLDVALFWVLLAGLVVLNIVGQQGGLPQPQGRYLFASIPFFVVCLGALCRDKSHANQQQVIEKSRAVTPEWTIMLLGACGSVMCISNLDAYDTAAGNDRLVTRDSEGRVP